MHKGIYERGGKCEENVAENNRESKRDFREISIVYVGAGPSWLPDSAQSACHALGANVRALPMTPHRNQSISFIL
jgi:hypothetical protein